MRSASMLSHGEYAKFQALDHAKETTYPFAFESYALRQRNERAPRVDGVTFQPVLWSKL
jgi:hypothetical protein